MAHWINSLIFDNLSVALFSCRTLDAMHMMKTKDMRCLQSRNSEAQNMFQIAKYVNSVINFNLPVLSTDVTSTK